MVLTFSSHLNRRVSVVGRRQKTLLLFITLGLFVQCARLLAATYYVSTTGSDANSGTQLQPWLTIQKAANTMNPGDTVIVTTGTYTERVATGRNGSQGAPITFQAQGSVQIDGFDIGHTYNIIAGFEITGPPVSGCSGSAAIYFRSGGRSDPSYSIALSNNIHDIWCVSGQTTNNYNGIVVDGINPVVANNTIRGCTPVGIVIGGASSIISNNWVENVPNGIYCFGTNHDICDNVFTNINSPGGLGTHPDIFQSWGTCGGLMGSCHNIVFERNYAVDSDAGICQMTDDCSTNSVSDWTIRNNVFVRIADAATVQFPGAHWYNNTFYRCNQNSGAVLTFGYDPTGVRGQAWRGDVENNAFVECGPTPNDTTRGWYSADTNLTDFIADYNYIGASNGVAKTTSLLSFTEAHGINGGLPNFVNPGADFHLSSGSVLIDAGTTLPGFTTDFDGISRPQGIAWDIGAVEFGTGSQSSNPPPVIGTPPTVTNPALQVGNLLVVVAGDTSVFNVGATDPDGDTLFYTWTFGDGAASSRSTVSTAGHVYTGNCGSYTASVTVDDGTHSTNAELMVSVACQLTITRLQARLNFARTNADSCTVRGTFDLPADHNFAGQLATVNIGGAEVSFALDSKRSGRSGRSTFGRPTYSKKTGLWRFSARLQDGSWQSAWAGSGMINDDIPVPGVLITNQPVILVLDTQVLMGATNLHYTARRGKSGRAK